MPSPGPQPLPENKGLVFAGEIPWTIAQLTARQAQSFEQARNPTGRSNTDVIRHFIEIKSGRPNEYAQVDFPTYFTEQEAALYVRPFSHLVSAKLDSTNSWWLNPNAQPELRNTLARLDRYLATPLAGEISGWDWIDSQRLPSASLLVVARDDDFTHGLLQSCFFTAWWHRWSQQECPRLEIIAAFPFPWPPATLFSALSRIQEEHRSAIARAARLGQQDAVDSAVAAAYGCSLNFTNDEVVEHLEKLNQQRCKPGAV